MLSQWCKLGQVVLKFHKKYFVAKIQKWTSLQGNSQDNESTA